MELNSTRGEKEPAWPSEPRSSSRSSSPTCRSFRAGFIWNDPTYVTENRTLDGPGASRGSGPTRAANEQYYPLVFTTYWIEKRLWGLHPLGYHLVNVLLHGIGALLLWRLLRRLALPAAWLAAAAFALHPVCVESVAWVTERKNTLSLVLSLARGPRIPRLARRPRGEGRGGRGGREVDGTEEEKGEGKGVPAREGPVPPEAGVPLRARLSPPSRWPSSPRRPRASFRPSSSSSSGGATAGSAGADAQPLLPFFASAPDSPSTRRGSSERWSGRRATSGPTASLERVVLAGQTTTFYAAKILWPADLMFIYPRWSLDAGSLRPWLPALGWAAALGGAALLVRSGRRGPLAGLLLFGGVLFPAMGFFNVYAMRYSWVADHFAYQAVAVAAAVLVCGAASLLAPLPPLMSQAGDRARPGRPLRSRDADVPAGTGLQGRGDPLAAHAREERRLLHLPHELRQPPPRGGEDRRGRLASDALPRDQARRRADPAEPRPRRRGARELRGGRHAPPRRPRRRSLRRRGPGPPRDGLHEGGASRRRVSASSGRPSRLPPRRTSSRTTVSASP